MWKEYFSSFLNILFLVCLTFALACNRTWTVKELTRSWIFIDNTFYSLGQVLSRGSLCVWIDYCCFFTKKKTFFIVCFYVCLFVFCLKKIFDTEKTNVMSSESDNGRIKFSDLCRGIVVSCKRRNAVIVVMLEDRIFFFA